MTRAGASALQGAVGRDGASRLRRAQALALALLVLVALAGACAAQDPAAPATATADEQHTIAFLRAVAGSSPTEPTLLQELREAGFVAGRNLTILAGDPDEAYPDPADAERMAAQWQRMGVDVIVALSTSGAAAARAGAPDTNVLFLSNDPTSSGLVANERSPDGRLTGVTFRVPADRTLDLARRAIPGLRRVGLILPADDPAAAAHMEAVAVAAQTLEIDLVVEAFRSAEQIGDAAAALAERGVDALLLSTSPTGVTAREETRSAAARHGLPLVANTSLVDGALIALYPDSAELGRQLGRQAARLLSGHRPGAVPVEDPRRYLLRVNTGVADELGIAVSEEVIEEANDVITKP